MSDITDLPPQVEPITEVPSVRYDKLQYDQPTAAPDDYFLGPEKPLILGHLNLINQAY